MKQQIDTMIEQICLEDTRYHEEAYFFLLESLSFTQRKFQRPTHVSGKELLEGVKELVMKRFGPMGLNVLHHWGITSTESFGHMVFNLVEKGILSKTESDSLDDFKDVYDLDHVFNNIYRQRMGRQISRMR